MTNTVPPLLATMREITGTKEVQGVGDSPVIMAWRDYIAKKYPDLAAYCATYTHDSIAWCGLTMAYVCARNNVKPVKEFLWADNWRHIDKWGGQKVTALTEPVLGCILTFKREGGNHVTLYVRTDGKYYVCNGGNQSDSVNETREPIANCTGMMMPQVGSVQPASTASDTVMFTTLVSGGFFSASPYDSTVPVSIRMNNPGALNIAPWIRELPGFVGDKLTSMSGSSPNSTVVFSAPEYGVAAWWKLLDKYRAAGAKTVAQIITRYGGTGQDYSDYVRSVVGWTGIKDTDEIKLTGDDATLLKFAKAMFRLEAGRPTPLSDAQIMFGIALARGTAPTAVSPPASAAAKDAGRQGVWALIVGGLAAAGTTMGQHPVITGIAVAVVIALVVFGWRWWHHHKVAQETPAMTPMAARQPSIFDQVIAQQTVPAPSVITGLVAASNPTPTARKAKTKRTAKKKARKVVKRRHARPNKRRKK